MTEKLICLRKLAMMLIIDIFFSCSTNIEYTPALIPMPQKLIWNNQYFKMKDSSACFVQRIVPQLPKKCLNSDEAYTLSVSNDSVILEATTNKGLFRGLQTVKQLAFKRKGKLCLKGCAITDWPAFSMRGFMQDVGRNYMPVSLLKEQIDVMTAYKFNVFHFHVTENSGWRLQSKRYPELASPESMNRWKGKVYTQAEFIDLIDYCRERYIILIPEFDVPGHCAAFRKAFAIDSMSDKRVQFILSDLIDELFSLVSKEKMPFIHLGTDEVCNDFERPAPELLSGLIKQVEADGREVIVWRPGLNIEQNMHSITQLWSSGGIPKEGHRYLDSRLNYLNHLDPLAGVQQLYFDRICGVSHGDSLRLGGILCCWNDNLVNKPEDIIKHNMVYPGMLTYSETSWTGQQDNFGEDYLAKFPPKGKKLFKKFCDFEGRLLRHRKKYFVGKFFPYVKQTNIEWKVLGPIKNKGDIDASFFVEKFLQKSYLIDSVEYFWQGPFVGGTIHLNHFFGYPSYFPKEQGTYYAFTRIWSPKKRSLGAWIGFHDWSRSGGRRGGPFPDKGEWHNTHPKILVNNELVIPPVWNNPGLASNTEEIPFSDENYYFRKPNLIHLKKGWNEVLLKIPVKKDTWKRMFTFVPIKKDEETLKEVEGLIFSAEIK